jgi:hypothetical protein
MSLPLTTIRTIAHTSVMTGVLTVLILASKLTPKLLRPLRLRSISTISHKEAPKASTVSQRFLIRRVQDRRRTSTIILEKAHKFVSPSPQSFLARRFLEQQRIQKVHASTVITKENFKAVRPPTSQKFLARRVREQQRINQKYIQRARDAKAAMASYRRWASSWSGLFVRKVLPLFLGVGFGYCIT